MVGPKSTVRYRTGCLPFLVTIAFGTSVLFAIATVRPSLVLDILEQRRAGWLAHTDELAILGVNIPVALIAIYMFYELGRSLRRIFDPRVLVSDEARVHFHPTERRKPIAWSEIREVSHVSMHLRSELRFKLQNGRGFRLRNCDECDAERFVDEATRLLTPRALPDIPQAI